MPAKIDHAAEIHQINDEYRACCLNKKYYGRKLEFYRNSSRFLDFFIALSATLAALKLDVLKNQEHLLQWVAAIAAITALVKTGFGFEKAVEKYTKLFSGYSDLTHSFGRLAAEIKIQRGMTDSIRTKVSDYFRLIKDLNTLDDPRPRKKTLLKIQAEIEEEIPNSSLFWPSCEPPGSA